MSKSPERPRARAVAIMLGNTWNETCTRARRLARRPQYLKIFRCRKGFELECPGNLWKAITASQPEFSKKPALAFLRFLVGFGKTLSSSTSSSMQLNVPFARACRNHPSALARALGAR
eukprot:9466959-Pyramimonas_sp.AAC.1